MHSNDRNLSRTHLVFLAFAIGLLSLIFCTRPAFAAAFEPIGPQEQHALMLELYEDLEAMGQQHGRTLKHPSGAYIWQGSEWSRVVAAAEYLGIPIEAVYVTMSGAGYFHSQAASPHYIEISEFVVRFESDLALGFHLAHEYAHLTLGHMFKRLAQEYLTILEHCPDCVFRARRGFTLLMRDDALDEELKWLHHAHEFEADEWAVRRLVERGAYISDGRTLFDLAFGADRVEKYLDDESPSHPSHRRRIEAVDRLLAELGG